MVAAEGSPDEYWRSLSSKLGQDRRILHNNLMRWQQKTPFYDRIENIFEPYLDLLFKSGLSTTGHHIFKDKRDVEDNLRTLKKLHMHLELEIVRGSRSRIENQIAVIYALKKIGLLLCDLDRINKGEGTIIPDADFQDWIREKLQNDDWQDYLEFVNANERDVLYTAAAQGVELNKQTITAENIRVRDVDEVKSRLTVYHKELEAAYDLRCPSVDYVGRAPYWCELIKQIISQQAFRCLVEPENDVEEERQDRVRSAELTEKMELPKDEKIESVTAEESSEQQNEKMELPKDEKMESVAAKESPEQIWGSLGDRLSHHRLMLVLEDWDTMPFLAKEQVLEPYLDLLFKSGLSPTGHHIYKDGSDVKDDLEILLRLHNQLESDIVEGKRNSIKKQIAIVYALKKIGLLLCDLDHIHKGEGAIIPDADFQDWIRQRLQNEDWEDYLKSVDANENDLLCIATAEGVEFVKQTITPENIRVRDVDEVKSRLTVYHKELEAAYNLQAKNVDCIGFGPYWCELTKQIVSLWNNKCLVKPDENIMGKRGDGGESAEVTVHGSDGLKRRRTEVSEEVSGLSYPSCDCLENRQP